MKYLITGSSGFVGRKFVEHLSEPFVNCSILGIDISMPSLAAHNYNGVEFNFKQVDLRDREKLCKVVYDFAPDRILHLASYSSVAGSWKSPAMSFQNNVSTFLNLVEAVRSIGLNCRIISVGSSEEYGTVEPRDLPLQEEHKLNPASPFAIARMSQELVAKLYAEVYGLDIIMTRSFNHIGNGMPHDHAVASFAKQLVEIKLFGKNEMLVGGDTSIVRDFVDVRDVTRAYDMLFGRGKRGEVYNICSGSGISLSNIIRILCDFLEIKIIVKENKQLLRPKDNPVMIGSNEKMSRDVGWRPEISIEASLKDLLEYYKSAMSNPQNNSQGRYKKV